MARGEADATGTRGQRAVHASVAVRIGFGIIWLIAPALATVTSPAEAATAAEPPGALPGSA